MKRRKKNKPSARATAGNLGSRSAVDSNSPSPELPQNATVTPNRKTDLLGNFRRPPTPEEAVRAFEFEEVGGVGGVKRLKHFSNSTATAVMLEAPLLDLDLFNARQFVRRKEKEVTADGVQAPTIETIKTEFPRLANWCYDEEIKTAVFGELLQVSRSWVNEIISNRLGIPAKTVERYRHKRSLPKPAKD